jgi:hypothetical protein
MTPLVIPGLNLAVERASDIVQRNTPSAISLHSDRSGDATPRIKKAGLGSPGLLSGCPCDQNL